MNPNFASNVTDLQKIYKQSKSVYLQKGYSYKSRVRQCTFTNSLLKKPVVMCRKGFLFNRDSLLKALSKKNLPQRLNYITSITDICRVELNPNKNKKNRFPFCCPLTAKVLNGSNPFVLVWSCGCLMYEKLLFPLASIKISLDQIEKYRDSRIKVKKEFERLDYKCPNCRMEFALKDIHSLNLSTKKKIQKISKNKIELVNNLNKKTSPMKDKNILLGKRNTPNIQLNFQINVDVDNNVLKRLNAGTIISAKSQKSKKASEKQQK